MSRPQVIASASPGNSLPAFLVLKKVIWTKEGELTEGWRKLRNEKYHDWYCSPNIVSVIK
jgi:hypothetical protein